MRTVKTLLLCLGLSVLTASSICTNCFAAGTENSVTKSEVYMSYSKDKTYNFKQEITENNQQYKLGDVKYEIVSEDKEMQKKHETAEERKENLYSKIYDISNAESVKDLPKHKEITVGDTKYQAQLEKIEYENIKISNRTADVSTTAKFLKADIKDSIDYDYKDEDTGLTYTVSIPKESEVETSETKTSTSVFPVVFHKIESGIVVINGKNVPIQDGNTPISSGYFPDLKAESDYKNSDGEITALTWDGGTYTSNGELCRNALATLTTSENLWTATYSGTANLPDADGYNAILTYGIDVDEPTGRTNYQIRATATYNPVEVPADNTATTIYIIVGLVILAILIAVILAVIARNKKSKKI